MHSAATATKPVIFSSVNAYQQQQDAKNTAQKMGLPMKTIEAIPGIVKRVEELERIVEILQQNNDR